MQQTGKTQPGIKKAYEISYALFRIGAKIGNLVFKEHLERQGLGLLSAMIVGDYAAVNTATKSIEYLVKFGSDVGIIHESNAEVMVVELNALNAAIAGLGKAAGPELVSLESIFSNQESLFRNSVMRQESEDSESGEQTESGNEPELEVETNNTPGSETNGIIKSAVRQTAIVERIRQSGNCRLKDIQELLPQASERTLRYDLQTLIEQNIIERVGSGGPAVYYRVRSRVQEA